jgi:ribosomal protein S27AE
MLPQRPEALDPDCGAAVSHPGAAAAAEPGGAQVEHHCQICPNCGHQLSGHHCKLVCSGCGYYMSCADYY